MFIETAISQHQLPVVSRYVFKPMLKAFMFVCFHDWFSLIHAALCVEKKFQIFTLNYCCCLWADIFKVVIYFVCVFTASTNFCVWVLLYVVTLEVNIVRKSADK